MYAPHQIPKPKNWQDLETLCLAIWKKEWNTRSFKTYGRPGQHQDGVDVFGRIDEGTEYGAIQCKCKEEEKKLTEAIIKAEVKKAKSFKPKLKRYIIATTFDSDVKLDSFVAEQCSKNMEAGLFSIDLFCWQDIEKLLELHPDVRDWYLNLTQRKEQSCEVTVEEPVDLTIKPVYKRTHFVHKIQKQNSAPKYGVMDVLGANRLEACIQAYQNQIKLADVKIIVGDLFHTRCKIQLALENTSAISMKDVRVVVRTHPESKFYYEQSENKMFSGVARLSLLDRMIVLDNYVKFHNMEDYHPGDSRYLHEFYIEPPQDAEDLDLIVHVTALDFVDEKVFKLRINKQYYDQTCAVDSRVGEQDMIEPYIEPITK